MRSGFPIVYRLTQAQIDNGDANSIAGGLIDVIDANLQPTGKMYLVGAAGVPPQVIVTSEIIADAIVAGSAPNWEASTKVILNQIRVATVKVGDINVGDIMRSRSARTTGTTFDATEATNWEEVSSQVKVVDSLFSGATLESKANDAASLGTVLSLDGKIGTTDIITTLAMPTVSTQGYITLSSELDTGKYANGHKVYRRTMKGYYPSNGADVQNVNGVTQYHILDITAAGRLLDSGGWIRRSGEAQIHLIKDIPNNGSHISAIYQNGDQIKIYNTHINGDFNAQEFSSYFEYTRGV